MTTALAFALTLTLALALALALTLAFTLNSPCCRIDEQSGFENMQAMRNGMVAGVEAVNSAGHTLFTQGTPMPVA